MARVVLITGGNLGDVGQNLVRARELIEERAGKVSDASPMMESSAWGFVCAERFLNQVLAVETPLAPLPLLDVLQQIERELGRVRSKRENEAAPQQHTEQSVRHRDDGQRYASRTIDIDILFYDDMVLDTPRLTLPHPLIQEREFVLAPLCAILPGLRHPRIGRSMTQLRELLHRDRPAEPYSVVHTAQPAAGIQKMKTT